MSGDNSIRDWVVDATAAWLPCRVAGWSSEPGRNVAVSNYGRSELASWFLPLGCS